MATPALSEGMMYVRAKEHLFAIGHLALLNSKILVQWQRFKVTTLGENSL